MYNHIFYSRAAKDFREAVVWYEERSEETADRFILAVEQRIQSICTDPLRYRNMYRNFYETSILTFPFTIVYLIKKKDKMIVISSLYHHKRNPKKKYRR